MPPVKPMLAKAATAVPAGDFLYEPKWDGFRCLAFRDGEIVIAGPVGLDFEALLQRIHPADSRVRMLAASTPASFVAFDLLALDSQSLLDRPQGERRSLLEQALAASAPPVHLTPATTDPALAREWFTVLEGAGLDGVVAKPLSGCSSPDKRTMLKLTSSRP